MSGKLRYRPALASMQPYVPGEQPQGGKFIKLNTNENPYPPNPKVVQRIAVAAADSLQRYPDPFADSFRRQAAETLKLPGPEFILAGNGSDEILTLLVRAFVGEGELLRLPYPSYILYRTLADIQGARWQQVPFDAGWKLPAALASPDPQPRLVFLPNPNSPSGTRATRDEVKQLAEQLPCPLIVDEAYADFADDNCLSLIDECDNVIITRTLSKSYALAGLRFGFCVARPDVIAELSKIKDSYNCDALAIAAATTALADQAWLETNRSAILAAREKMTAGLNELGFDTTPSQANFVWCTHPNHPSEKLFNQLKENQILIRFMQFPDWGEGLRITVGTEGQVDALLSVLKRLVQA